MKTIAFILFLTLGVAAGAFATDATATAKAAPPQCPSCHSVGDVIPIVYGYPSEELCKAAERGEVALGG